MSSNNNFDVLIVYSAKISLSAQSNSCTPFGKESGCESYNQVYSYFLESCRKNGLKAAFSTSSNITSSGTVNSYWTYELGSWRKHNTPCSSALIFDKFSPVNLQIKNKRRLLFSDKKIKAFNNTKIFDTFFDKYRTYQELKKYTIPTIPLQNSSYLSIKQACSSLRQLVSEHKNPNDFGKNIVMKDQFGAGGFQVYQFQPGEENMMSDICQANPNVAYIIQPLANFDRGFKYNNQSSPTDIRYVFLCGNITQTFIRIAKKRDFRCNAHQGCSIHYIGINNIPQHITSQAIEIAKRLPQGSNLFSIDFIQTNSGNSYLLEGNTGPGISWSNTDKIDEKMSKQLIRQIVQTLKKINGN